MDTDDIDHEAPGIGGVHRPLCDVINDFSNSIANYDNGLGGPDANGTVDCSLSLQRALNANSCVFIPPSSGGWRVDQTIQVASGKTITGIKTRSKLVKGGVGDLFRMKGDTVIENLVIEANEQDPGTALFRIDTTASCERIQLLNIDSMRSRGVIADGNAAGIIVRLVMRDFRHRFLRGPGVKLYDVFAYLELENTLMEYLMSGETASSNCRGYDIRNVEGMALRNAEYAGTKSEGIQSNQVGYYFKHCKALHLWRPFADNSGNIGMYFEDCDYIEGSTLISAGSNGPGITFDNCRDVTVNGFYVGGNIYQPNAYSGIHGVHVTNYSSDVILNGGRSRYNSGHGLLVDGGSQRIDVSNYQGQHNGLRGYATAGGNTTSKLSGGTLTLNQGGNYYLTGQYDHIRGTTIHAGNTVNVTGPNVGG